MSIEVDCAGRHRPYPPLLLSSASRRRCTRRRTVGEQLCAALHNSTDSPVAMTTPRKAQLPSMGGVQRESIVPASSSSSSATPSAAAASNGGDVSGSSVQVVVRCRPPSDKEKTSNDTMVVGCYPQHQEVRVITNGKKSTTSSAGAATLQAQANKADANTKTYTFDQTYGALSTQEEVYNQSVKPLVEVSHADAHTRTIAAQRLHAAPSVKCTTTQLSCSVFCVSRRCWEDSIVPCSPM